MELGSGTRDSEGSTVRGFDDLLSSEAAGPAAVRGGGLRGIGFLVGSIASIGSAALLFRHLGVTNTGRYVTIVSLVAVVAGFSDLGLTAIGVREASVRGDEERLPLLRDMLGMRIVLTLGGVAVVGGIAAMLYPGVIVAGVAIAGLALLLQVTQDNYAVLLQVDLRMGWVATLDMLRQLSTALFVGLLVLADARLLAFVAVAVAVGIVCLAVVTLLVRGRRSLLPAFHWARWRPLIVQILPYSAAVAATALYFRMAIILTSLLASEHQLGLFSASFRIIEFLTVIPALLVGVALPIFSRAAHTDLERLGYALGRVFEVALVVGGWIAVSLGVGASLVIAIIGGPDFTSASGVLQILGIALMGTFVSVVWGNALLSLRMHRELLAISLGMLVSSAVLIGLLASTDGAIGAAIGVVAGELGMATVAGMVLVRRHSELRPSLRIVPLVGLAAAVALTPMLASGIPVIVQLVASTALYGVVLILTRALPPELGALLPDALARRVPGIDPSGAPER
jgi:O-antigen/teichoic acid export membrane protein